MAGTLSPGNISTGLQRVAELAREAPAMVLTTLAHHIDLPLLRRAYERTPKNKATGVDRQTAASYAEKLEENLGSLLSRFKSGTYRAPPVRRVHIPKGDGKTRPIGIPTFEDKVLQRAVVMVLEAVYEQDFRDCSYGFRPGRSAHQMVQDLWRELMSMGGAWVLELDIKSYFDTIDHAQLRAFLDRRVRDGVIRRSIDKWLKAGVLEDGQVHHPEEGTPQGGVISPLLANLFLHEVLDKWFEDDVQPRMGGRSRLFRYADDAVLVFSSERDARRVLEVLPKRFAKYGLTLHPEKTRLVWFYPPSRPKPKDGPPDESFDLLGFTHHWKKSRRGKWIVARQTARKRFTRSLKAIASWCRENRHLKLMEQHKILRAKLLGHYQYYGITGNFVRLARFYHSVIIAWQKWLNRRSQRGGMTWKKWNLWLKEHPLPQPRVVHSVLTGAARP